MLRTLCTASKNPHQFVKFLIVGIGNTLAGYLIFVVLSLLSFEPAFALALTYIFAVPLNYLTTGKLVFNQTCFSSLFLFFITYGGIYLINLIVLNQVINLGVDKLLAQALIVPFIAVLSFLMFKHFVFRKS